MMVFLIRNTGILSVIKQLYMRITSGTQNLGFKHPVSSILYPTSCILCLVFCILCFVSFAGATESEDRQIMWTPMPSTEEVQQIQSYVALCRAVYWENMGNDREVKRQLESAIRLDPRSSFLYAKLARALYVLEDYRDAVDACETSLKLNPNNAEAHYLLGVLNFSRRDPRSRRTAINEFRKATELKPEHFRAQYYLGSILYEQADYSGAARAYSEMIKVKPYDYKLRTRLGVSYSKSGEIEKAIKELNAAIRLYKDYLDSHFHLAYLYAGQSMNKEAIEECLFVLKRSPGDPSMNLLLAEIYLSMNEFGKAMNRVKGLLTTSSRRMDKSALADAYYKLAAAYKGRGEMAQVDEYFQKSIDIYKEILEEDQGKIGVHYEIAMVYDAKGNLDLAERHLRKYIELDPDEPDAHNFLGYAFLQNDVNLEEAFTLIKKAVAMRPRSGAFRDSLGWAYFKLGDLDEAIAELEKAAKLMPGDSEIREHLGEAYLKKGGEYTEKALLEWEKAIEIKPRNNELQQKIVELRRALEQTENSEGGTARREEGTKEP